MKIADILLLVICISIPIAIYIVFAIAGIRSRNKYANQIREAQARGAFSDMNKPEYKSRTRYMALMALVGLLGMVLSIVILIFQQISGFTNLSGFSAISALFFGILSSVGGYLMKREIDRRL